jgi:phosphate transport system permease protein
VGTAAFLSEIASPMVKRVGSFLVELLAAIPSVVYGFWGVNFLAPPLQDLFNHFGGPNYGGKGLLASGLILAIMVVPYVAAVAYDVCQAVPSAQRQGSLALGATRWQTISRVVLPYAMPGITGGCFLALGRAIGETMAVTMLIGNTAVIEQLPFGRGFTIPSVLAQQLTSTTESPMHFPALVALALILFAVTILMSVMARVLIWQVGRGGRGPSLWSRTWPFLVAVLAVCILLGARSILAVTGPFHLQVLAIILAVAAFLFGLSRLPNLWKRLTNAQFINTLMTGVLALCLVVTCIPLFLILGYIIGRGVYDLNLNFFLSDPDGGGLRNALVGSAIIVGLAAVFALPVGLLAAIYLAEYRTKRLGAAVRFFGELLNGVPSIVVGTFVYLLMRIFVSWHLLDPHEQFSAWAGVLALTIMMVPIVMRSAEESLKLVPQTLRNASHALGAYHWQTVLRVSVPAATSAIITGAFLALARIAGETAPLLMTAFGNEKTVFDPSDKMGVVPVYIFRYSSGGYVGREGQAWAAAVVLLVFIMVLNVGVRFLTGRRLVSASRAD